MSAPLPNALRARFKACIEEGLSGRAAAARLMLSPATGSRWARAIRQHGDATPAPQGRPRGRGKLAPHQAFLEELVAQDPDITLYELRDALAMAEGVKVHHSSIAALLKRLGFTYKKIVGGLRTAPRPCKASPARVAGAAHSLHASPARTAGVH